MNNSLITVRYTKSLFELASENGKKNVVKKDMELIDSYIKESAEFREFLESPLIKGNEKLGMIEKIFKSHVDDITYSFLSLLVTNKREGYLAGICRYFFKLHRESNNVKEAVITTSDDISDAKLEEIKKGLAKKFEANIDLKKKTDPSIIGGFVLRIEDQQYNASVKTQLQKIKRELINS